MVDPDVVATVFPQFGGVRVDGLRAVGEAVHVWARATATGAVCPGCRVVSRRVHGGYERRVSDLPVGQQPVLVRLRVRRFLCCEADCPRRTFVEQVEGLTCRYRRRTLGLQRMLEAVATFLAGRAGARLAARLSAMVSRSTLLRLLRAIPLPAPNALRLVGIDDFAFRRGHVYGTVVIDIDTHRPVDVLPDRTTTTVADWLTARPGIEVICRDRAGAYAEAARTGAPDAVQVADRWHLWHNLAEAVEKVVTRHRAALAADVDPQEVSSGPALAPGSVAAQEVTSESAQPRPNRLVTRTIERHASVHALLDAGHSLAAVSRELRLDPHTVRRFARAATVEHMLHERLRRDSILDDFKTYLHQQWNAGVTDAARLTQEITALGYRGSDQTVRRYLHPLRASGRPAPPAVPTPPTVRQVTGWLTRRPEDVAEADASTLKQITTRCPALQSTQEFVRDFAKMLTQLGGEQLSEWLDRVDREGQLELRSFADSLRRDLAAVTAGLTLPHSSGAVEGNVNRIKTIKRQMYGRASFDLLRRRILLTA